MIISFFRSGLIAATFLVLLAGCVDERTPQLRIALSKGYPDTSYVNYYKWIKSLDSTAHCVDMYNMPEDSALLLFKSCSGLVLTGGTDIHPAFYGKAFDTVRCWPIDDHRDRLEMRLLDSALAWGLPVLGICRGHQMINVALGGSLVVDIPQDRGTDVNHQCEDYLTCFHNIRLDRRSRLYQITGSAEGEVNSNHHQAVDALAPGLKIAAYTADGIIESIEWADTTRKSFLLGVQWHPERMELSNPLSGAVGKRFVEECRTVRR